MRISTGTVMVCVVLLLGTVTAGTALWGRYMAQPGPLVEPTTVVIKSGTGTRVMAYALRDAHVIGNAEAFVLAVHAMRLDGTLKAGDYAFDPGISLRAVVNKIALGDTQNHSVTIPEGWTVRQIAQRLEAVDGLSGRISRPGEGEVFPDTYAFRFGTERDKLLATMKDRMKQEVADAWAARDTTVPLNNPEEMIILASIVQKEAANEAEMPKIAGVFVNRLRKGMRLQSDPTVAYGAEELGARLLRKDLTDPHPFNTYIHGGLPPAPISNPGRAALRAVAQPEKTTALFFVADPSFTMHIFTDTYEEHQKAVKRYWNTLSQRARDAKAALPATVSSSVEISVTRGVKNAR